MNSKSKTFNDASKAELGRSRARMDLDKLRFLTHFLPGLTGLHVHPHAKRDIQSELGKSRLANAPQNILEFMSFSRTVYINI